MKNHKRNILMTFLVMCLIYIILPKTQILATGSSMLTATNISMDIYYSGSVTGKAEDWYKFTTPNEYRSYTVSFLGKVGGGDNFDPNIYVDIVDEMEAKVFESDQYSTGYKETYTVKLSPNTTYYIRVKRVATNKEFTTGYTFNVTSTLDEPDTKTEANEISIKQLVRGNICSKNDNDYYKFTTGNENLRYEIQAIGISNCVNLSVYDGNDRELVSIKAAKQNGVVRSTDLDPNTTYYIKVYSDYATDYTFSAITRKMSFEWAEDYSSCILKGINTDNSEDVITEICTVTKLHNVDPTCVSVGRAVYKASYQFLLDANCYEDIKEVIIPARGHAVVLDEAVEATCTTGGKTAGSHCSICNAVITEQQIVPANGHTVVLDEAVAATCKQEGKTAGSHCSSCGTIFEVQQPIAKTQHKWSKWKITKKPTVTSAGKKRKTCSICGDVEYEQISKVKIKDIKIKKGKAQKITFSVLDKGDEIKTVTSPKNSKVKIKKLKKNQYQIIGLKKGTYTITVTLKSKKKFTFRVVIK